MHIYMYIYIYRYKHFEPDGGHWAGAGMAFRIYKFSSMVFPAQNRHLHVGFPRPCLIMKGSSNCWGVGYMFQYLSINIPFTHHLLWLTSYLNIYIYLHIPYSQCFFNFIWAKQWSSTHLEIVYTILYHLFIVIWGMVHYCFTHSTAIFPAFSVSKPPRSHAPPRFRQLTSTSSTPRQALWSRFDGSRGRGVRHGETESWEFTMVLLHFASA